MCKETFSGKFAPTTLDKFIVKNERRSNENTYSKTDEIPGGSGDFGRLAVYAKSCGMCLKLVERCDEMRVCGENITDGMRKEIRHAEKHNIPVFSEEHEVFQTQKPKMNLLGADGNVFYLLGCASRLLRQVGEHDKAQEMSDRLQNSGSYHEALNIISEYVETELSIEMPIAKTPTKSNKTKEKRNQHDR